MARLKGLVLGKFMPPHLGHCYLIDFARSYVDDLAIVVGTLPTEPIPGELRFAWMRELFPGAQVVHLPDPLPQQPDEHPDFWALWKAALERVMPFVPDVVFASEEYGAPLAALFGARFVPVDVARGCVPVSGTAVRRDPMANWRFLPRPVRPYFLRRVRIVGPESTGKTTLATRLAEHYGTVAVPEYAQGHIARQNGRIEAADIPLIARAQAASEDALAHAAERLLFCDSDLLTTRLWSETLFGACPPEVAAAASARRYDLTLLALPDTPWVDDVHRIDAGGRTAFLERIEDLLAGTPEPVVRLSGDWAAREASAVRAVDALLAPRS